MTCRKTFNGGPTNSSLCSLQTYDLSRYFCADKEVFPIGGRTYALVKNQWGLNTIPVVDEVIAKLPPGIVSYAKTTEAE